VIYVIGSGLSGIAAAAALVRRGFRPTILDAGIRPEPEVLEIKSRLASMEPDAWKPEDIERLKRIGPAASSGIPQKLHFGSNFAYREADRATSSVFDRASILRSFARGGFSNVWGAVIQRLPPAEFHRWPITHDQLACHYVAVQRLVSSSDVPVRPSTQARSLHDDLGRHRPKLQREGVRFDYAPLAVRSADDKNGKGCRHCGLCLYGCPYDSIFSAASQLERLVRDGHVSYVPDVLVDRVSVEKGGVRIDARSAKANVARSFFGKAVFVAAGLLESARIALNSIKHVETPLRVQQSDIFTIPMLRYRSTSNISRERLHTLCQTVIEIDDASICPQPVQLQLYGYNDLYSQILEGRAGALSGPLRPLIRAASERLMVGFGYLHSDVSSAVWISRTGTGPGRLRVEGEVNPLTKRVAGAVVQKLYRLRSYFRTVPVPMQLRFDDPGGGHRSGGCFPMRHEPGSLETDLWGRLPGLPGVHIVDASILPSIPAGPMAFTAMANAHRIASECPLRDDDHVVAG
jgi:choline dehydrogenase-like flavoprotein